MKSLTPRQLHLIFVLLLCLLPALLLFCGFFLAPQYDDTFLGEMKYKLNRLEQTSGKRIVMVGGSSVPFSMRSDLIAAEFPDYEIVDFGLYADMGTVVMLDFARTNIREGDIYVIMPEQHPQTLSDYFSGENVWQALDGNFHHLSLVNSDRYEQLAAAFPSFAGRKLFYRLHGSPVPDGIYTRASFNEYGDISCSGREYNTMDLGYNPNDPISFTDAVITPDFIAEINEFAHYATECGAAVYYHFPAMNQLALAADTTRASIDAYYDRLKDQLDFPILGNPHNSILESGWFYDTNFHLNESGAVQYTRLFVDDLKVLFGDTSASSISEISMPVTQSDTTPSATAYDNSDSEAFLYESTADGYLITGLTSLGLSATELTIPGSYEQQPVIGISETVFRHCTSLSRLTIQPNIGTLYDQMFLGCTSFKTLVLTGAPTDYSIGSELMSGSSFLIAVPKQELDHYKRHYSWQKYASYLTSPASDASDSLQ